MVGEMKQEPGEIFKISILFKALQTMIRIGYFII